MGKVIQLWACSLIFLLVSLSAAAQRITSPINQSSYPRQDILAKLAQASVVYLGETHDRPKDHQAQLDIVRSLYRLRYSSGAITNGSAGAKISITSDPPMSYGQATPIAIALEMFQRPYQAVLNRYLAGELTETQLQAQSQYNQRWGFSWEYYAPILRFAKEKHLPLLAINTPTEVSQKVSRTGLQSLTPAEQQFIPPLEDVDISNSAYRQLMLRIYQDFHSGKDLAGFEKFFQAQVLWDETMAEAIANFLRSHRGSQVIVLAGQGHIRYGYGIPSRVARRMAASQGKREQQIQYSVLINPTDTETQAKPAAADYFWFN